MGETPLNASSWQDAGHRLGHPMRDVLEAGHAFLVVSAPGGRYVHLHAHPDGLSHVVSACRCEQP